MGVRLPGIGSPRVGLFGRRLGVQASAHLVLHLRGAFARAVWIVSAERIDLAVGLNASEHTDRGVTLVSTTHGFIRGVSGTTAERFRPAFRRDP
jgi:hypothetical protein